MLLGRTRSSRDSVRPLTQVFARVKCFTKLIMKLCIEVVNSVHSQRLEHEAGPLEFGRGPQRQTKRCLIDGDPTVSRDQLRIEQLADGRIRLENLSQRNPVVLPGRFRIAELHSMEVELPIALVVGQTNISIQSDAALEPPATPDNLKTVDDLRLEATWNGQDTRWGGVGQKISQSTAAQRGCCHN